MNQDRLEDYLKALIEKVIADYRQITARQDDSFISPINIYPKLIQAYIDHKEYDRAIETVEQSKAYDLIRSIVDRDVYSVDKMSPQILERLKQLPDFAEIQKAIPNRNTAIIEWYFCQDKLFAFIIFTEQSQPVLISYSEEEYRGLISSIQTYVELYQHEKANWKKRFPHLLTSIAESLQLENILAQLPTQCDRLILILDRLLNHIPIHALPLNTDRSANKQPQYLIDRFTGGVAYAPSLQLLKLTQKNILPPLKTFFAVQNPTGDLSFSNVEVTMICHLFQPNDEVVTRKKATKSALTSEKLNNANCIHFSGHGNFNFDNPLRSVFLLADSPIYPQDKDGERVEIEKCLTLSEVCNLELNSSRLVTLSVPETYLSIDNSLSFASAFILAGSCSVLSSFWGLSDLSTAILMIKFYQNLKEMDSVVLALDRAQKWLRQVDKEQLTSWTKELPQTGARNLIVGWLRDLEVGENRLPLLSIGRLFVLLGNKECRMQNGIL